MAVSDGNANGGRANLDGGIAEDLARFVEELELFGGIAAFFFATDLREAVEPDRIGEGLAFARSVLIIIGQPRVGAGNEIAGSGESGAARRLIGAHDDATDASEVMERLERDDHLRSGAVRARNQALVLEDILSVDFRNDEGNVWIHSPISAFVDDDLHAFARLGHEIAGHVVRGAGDDEIDVVEGVRAEFFHRDGTAVKRDNPANASLRGEELHLLIGELSFL